MPITTSIIAAVVGAALYASLGILVKRIVIPWIQSITHDDADLSGEWYSHFTSPSENEHHMTLSLHHYGCRLKGQLHVTKRLKKTAKTETKDFSVEGSVRDRFVVLNARNKDKHAIGVHTVLLEVIGDARTMKGFGSWYSITKQRIQPSRFEWEKASTQPNVDSI